MYDGWFQTYSLVLPELFNVFIDTAGFGFIGFYLLHFTSRLKHPKEIHPFNSNK